MSERLHGLDLFGNLNRPKVKSPVADRFLFPPFTTLDARSGEWQERKRKWAAMGIRGEEGRSDELTYTGAARGFDTYRVKEGTRAESAEQGTSLFDPVLCELAYRWFSPPGGLVLDPFAGGSVRGIVAGESGRAYWGGGLRPEQVEANRRQAEDIGTSPRPEWVCGDSRETIPGAPAADFVFSCPPYGDLERYSDRPDDLSAMDWPAFLSAYREIVAASVAKLRRDRFACFVVGDFRDGRGVYRNFVSETIRAFLDAGADLYNEAILLTAVGSASMRVSRQFSAGRKLCKVHQNVLVFVKGDGRRAADACGAVDVA